MEPYVGEIRLLGFGFTPGPSDSWANCDGQILSISDYNALFSLIGTTYGGDGITTFALPNLKGRATVNQGQLPGGSNYVIGQMAGSENVALSGPQLPSHNHAVMVVGNGEDSNSGTPAGHALGLAQESIYNTNAPEPASALNSQSIQVQNNGGGQPHPNMQPYLTMSYCMALNGVYPSRP